MMLSPIQFGIPNDRKRYYLTAYLPSTPTLEPIEYPLDGSNIIKEVSDYIPGYKTPTMRPLSEYIDDDSNDMPDLLVNSAHIRKRTNFR